MEHIKSLEDGAVVPVDLNGQISLLLLTQKNKHENLFEERADALLASYNPCSTVEEKIAKLKEISQLYDAYISLTKGYKEAEESYARVTERSILRSEEYFLKRLAGLPTEYD